MAALAGLKERRGESAMSLAVFPVLAGVEGKQKAIEKGTFGIPRAHGG